MTKDESTESVRLTRLWEQHAHRIHAYALRHVGPDQAQEVVAETFLVAWRRLADVPGSALPWLLVVARNTVRASRRSSYRARLVDADLDRITVIADERVGVDVLVTERDALLRALQALNHRQREALFLVAWDGLSITEAAAVAGCSPGAFRVRLHRARERLRTEAEPEDARDQSDSRSSHITPTPAAATVERF